MRALFIQNESFIHQHSLQSTSNTDHTQRHKTSLQTSYN